MRVVGDDTYVGKEKEEKKNMNVREKIVKAGRMTVEQLDAAVKQKMKDGARTVRSAENKVYRDIAVETLGNEDVAGFFMQEYIRKNERGVSGYVQKEDGATLKIGIVEGTPKPETTLGRKLMIADPVVMSNCVKKKNVFTGTVFYETSKNTAVKEATISTPLVDCCADFTEKMQDGIYTLRGTIERVWAVRPFGSKDKNSLPILDRGGVVNLRVVVNSGGQTISVKIPDELRLKLLIGSDIEWLDTEGAIKELSDMLRGIPVVVFGRLGTVIFKGKPEEKSTNPFMQIKNFGFLLPVDEKGTKVVDAKSADVDDDDEDELVEDKD